jgi:type I restriction enzyme S subunit
MNNLPKRWVETTLGEVVQIKYGKDHKHLADGKYPLYGSGGIMRYVEKPLYNKESILIPRKGTLNNLFYVDEPFWSMDTIFYSEINTNKVIPVFLFFYLKTFNLAGLNVGSAVPSLTTKVLNPLKLFIPALSEQKAIAKILSSFDEKIELLRQQNETLETIAQTIFKEWFVKGKQNNWNTVKLGDLVKTNVSTINKHSNIDVIKYLDTGSITEGFIEEIQEFNIADAPSRARRIVQHNDVLISTVRPNLKHYGILKQPYDNLVVSTGFCVITCEKIDPHFIYLLLTSNDMTEYLHSIAEGSTSTYPSLKPSDIECIEFKLPPEKKLKSFSEYADSTWNKIRYNQLQIETLTKTRDTLLPKLMNGEIRAEGFEN